LLLGEWSASEGPSGALWLRRTDGSPPIRLGEGAPVALSPDGKWALAVFTGNEPRLVLYPTGAGEPRQVPLEKDFHVLQAYVLPGGDRLMLAGTSTRWRQQRVFERRLESPEMRP